MNLPAAQAFSLPAHVSTLKNPDSGTEHTDSFYKAKEMWSQSVASGWNPALPCLSSQNSSEPQRFSASMIYQAARGCLDLGPLPLGRDPSWVQWKSHFTLCPVPSTAASVLMLCGLLDPLASFNLCSSHHVYWPHSFVFYFPLIRFLASDY